MSTTLALKEQLLQLFLSKIQEEKTSKRIAAWCNEFLQDEYLGTAFNGQLTFWVEHNLQKMLQFFIPKIIEMLKSKQGDLTKVIQDNIINHLSCS